MDKKSKFKSEIANSLPVNMGQGLKTKKDYHSTQEYVKYSRETLKKIRPRLARKTFYVKPIQQILMANGFDYPKRYILDCILECRDTWNIYVTKACEIYVNTYFPEPDQIVMMLPEEKPTGKTGKPRNMRPLSQRLGLVKV